MFRLPTRSGIEEDELLLSYALRNWNPQYENFKDFCNHYFVPGDYKNNALSVETVSVLESAKTDRVNKMEVYLGGIAAQENMGVPDLFFGHSMHALEFPLLLRSNQGKAIDDLFNSYPTEICPPGNSPLQTIRCCPRCIERDLQNKGEFLLYRKHQIPYIKCCPEHGCELIKIDNPLHINCSQKPEDFVDKTGSLENIRFSQFCWSFLQQQTCLEDVCSELFKALSLNGYTSSSGIKLLHAQAKNWLGDTTEHQLSVCINQLTSPTYVNKELILRLVWFCMENEIEFNLAPLNNDVLERSSLYSEYSELEVITANGYLAVMCDPKTGNMLYLSPFQIATGWPLPKLNTDRTDLAARIISGITDSEYELIDHFANADTPIRIKHSICGRIQKWKFRNFVYEGVRCPCESQITLEEAKAKIEGSGEFELVEFHGGNIPVRIKHKLCGRTFAISYHKFIQRPWCKVCNPRIRDAEYFKQQVRNLVGDEYVVLGDYIDSHTPILMLHNSSQCQREFSIAPSHFLEGGRCTKCSGIVPNEEFKRMVENLSFGQYRITCQPTRNLFEIQNVINRSTQKLSKSMILQELRRPTPSSILPIESDKTVKENEVQGLVSTNVSKVLREWILTHYDKHQIIFTEDIPEKITIDAQPISIPYDRVKSVLSGLVKNGILERLEPGMFCFKGCSFLPEEVIASKYILRNGQQIGYITGASFASSLGLCNKPNMLQISTNKESGTHGRTVKCVGTSLKIKGPSATITETNYKVLSLLDILQFGKKYLKSSDDYRKVGKYIKNNGLKIDDFTPYMQFYPNYTRNFLNTVYKLEVWNESTN